MASHDEWKRWSFKGGHEWCDWMPFSTSTFDAIRAQPGAYVLGLPDHRGPLGRLLGQDPHGLLDVGEAESLRDRLAALRRCATTRGQCGHMAGWRLGSMGLLARLDLRPEDLRLSVCYAGSKVEAYAIEGAILRDYYDLFGELPPLNYKFNWSTWEDT